MSSAAQTTVFGGRSHTGGSAGASPSRGVDCAPEYGFCLAEAQRWRCGAPGRHRLTRVGDIARVGRQFRAGETNVRATTQCADGAQSARREGEAPAEPPLRFHTPKTILRAALDPRSLGGRRRIRGDPNTGLGVATISVSIRQHGLIGCRALPRQRFLVGDRTLAARQEPRPPVASSAPRSRRFSGGCRLGAAR